MNTLNSHIIRGNEGSFNKSTEARSGCLLALHRFFLKKGQGHAAKLRAQIRKGYDNVRAGKTIWKQIMVTVLMLGKEAIPRAKTSISRVQAL